MEVRVTQDQAGTHIDWDHDGVTPRMIDWFWSNMEKANLLWHPEQHRTPRDGTCDLSTGRILGSVHIAPQTWDDGTRQNLYIKTQDPRELPREITDLDRLQPLLCRRRVHRGHHRRGRADGLSGSINGRARTLAVVGRSSALSGLKKDTPEEGLIWVEHCKQEIGNWGVFSAPAVRAVPGRHQHHAQPVLRPDCGAEPRPASVTSTSSTVP